ncbi:MAG TPA: response regulator, partial [Polyangiaceae bacterium]|nr:response regulator [Polyangiaceae bacterium]
MPDPANDPTAALASGPRARILLVDDRPENLMALEVLLRHLGHELVQVGSGEEALAALTTGDEFALILLDVRMPGLDGLETAARMRERGAVHAPIIFVTADGATPHERRAYELGAADVLVKPIDPAELLAKVAVFIELFRRGQRIRQEDAQRTTRERELKRTLDAPPDASREAELGRLRLENAWLREAVRDRDDLIGIAPSFFGFLTPDGLVTAINDLALRVIEAERDQVVGQRFWEGPWWASIPESAVRVRTAVEEAALGRGSHFDLEYWAVQRGIGRKRWVALAIEPFRDADGKVQRIAATGSDITERELARAELHSLFTQAPAPICVLNGPAHTFVLANRAYMRLLGVNRNVVGLPIRQAIPEFEGQGFFELLDRVFTTGERFVGSEAPVQYRRPDGASDEGFVSFVYEPFRDAERQVIGILVVAFDVTETVRARRAAEATLAARERLLALTEEARIKAESASRSKDEFLAVVSHELRTPLNSILGWARILRAGGVDPTVIARGLETIERNGKAQVQLIEDILDSSRIVTGKLHLEVRPLDLMAVIESALDAVRPAAAAKEIALAAELDPAAARIRGDADRLQQVVWNLVNNAIKFTPRGGNVAVYLRRAGTSIELTVVDSGQGIAADLLPHLFERFRQGDASTTRRHGGLGLGLALARHLVEAHGGTVRAESAGEGRGATFTVTLPVQAVFPDTPESNPRATPTTEARRARLSATSLLLGVRVLVVDDEPDARDLVATVLRRHGAVVAVAASAEEALAQLEVTPPDVLVSDIGMPVTDGHALIRQV